MVDFTVTVAGGSQAHGRRGAGAHMTLHRAECGVVKRAKEVRPEYLSGWVSVDDRAVEPGGYIDTPAQVSRALAEESGPTTYEKGERGMRVYAAAFVEKARMRPHAYRLCGRCLPEVAVNTKKEN